MIRNWYNPIPLYKILFDSQRFASCSIYYLKTYASTECLKQTSTLQTFAFIMNWMKIILFHLLWRIGPFLCQHETSKIKNTIDRHTFCCSIYSLQHYAHHRKTTLLRFLSTQKTAYLDSRKKHFEPPHDKTNKLTFVPSEDSDLPGHPPSLIRAFAVRSVGSLGLNFASGGQCRIWSDWADAQADLSHR